MNRLTIKCAAAALILLLMMAVCSPAAPVYAEEAPEEPINLVDVFYVLTTQQDHSLLVPFDRSWFRGDARVYDHDLAKLSLGLATSAFRPNKQLAVDTRPQDYNLRSFLYQAGFEDLRSDDYDKNPSMYTVSTVMGHQKIGEGDDAFELIAVGICGQGYMDEWESNLSIGTGRHPEGFYNAAHLVYDRVFGYISENHLRGKKKIWISGFSRAAAVSNIAASLLSDSDTFSQETVFAYTFATPGTVRDKEPKVYENIFNICGKMDPVPNVPFADWGYSRYGTTYFTPTLETDSDFWEKRKKADKVYEDLTGISYWTNPDMNSQLRILMDCMLGICPDVETYHAGLQDHLISLWEKHDAVSVLNGLLEMANDPLLINDENRLEANVLLNQITFLLLDYASEDNVFLRFNKNASLGSNLLQTHTPELYVSWVFSADDPAELYTDSYNYTLMYVDGDVEVTLSRDGEVLEHLESGERDVTSRQYLSVRNFKISVLIPRDHEYLVSIRSVRDQTVETLEADYQVGRHAPDETAKYSADMKAGDVMRIGFNEYGRELYPDGSFETAYEHQTERSLTSIELMNAYTFFDDLSWRDVVLFFLMAVVLLVTTVLFVISLLSMWIRHRYKRDRGYIPKDIRFRPLPIICFFLIQQLFLTREFLTALYEPSVAVINDFKIVTGILILIIAFYGYRRKKDRFHLLIIIAVLLLTGADVAMTVSVSTGALLYIAAYIFLCVNFAWDDPPGVFRVLLWAAASAAVVWYLMRIPGDHGHLRTIAIAYAIAGSALIVMAFTQSARTSWGCLLLFAAGIMIALDTARGSSFLFHFIAAGLHYIAVCTLASTGSGFTLPRITAEGPALNRAEGETNV